MRRLILIIILAFSVAKNVGAMEKVDEIDCLVAVRANVFIAFFPARNMKQEVWVWNSIGTNPSSMEYSWVGEPGYVDRGGKFIKGRYAFGLGYLSNSPFEGERNGSFEELIGVVGDHAKIFLNDANKKKRAEAESYLRSIRLHSKYKEGGLMIASRSPEAVKYLFVKRPTVARMIVKTPYASQSYECIATIDYHK